MRVRKLRPWLAVLLLGCGSGAWWLSRPRLSDRALIERVVEQIEKGVERKRLGQALAQVSANYHDRAGTTHSDLRRLSFALMRSQVSVEIAISRFRLVDLQAGNARGLAEVEVLAREGGAEFRGTGPVVIMFRKERRRWKVVSAEGWQGWVPDIY